MVRRDYKIGIPKTLHRASPFLTVVFECLQHVVAGSTEVPGRCQSQEMLRLDVSLLPKLLKPFVDHHCLFG
jgi:hypothetical protein